jgi:hypothetical protein
MRAAIENEPAREMDPRDVFTPAAEAWISIAGPQMYHWDKEFEYDGNRGYVSLLASLSEAYWCKLMDSDTDLAAAILREVDRYGAVDMHFASEDGVLGGEGSRNLRVGGTVR